MRKHSQAKCARGNVLSTLGVLATTSCDDNFSSSPSCTPSKINSSGDISGQQLKTCLTTNSDRRKSLGSSNCGGVLSVNKTINVTAGGSCKMGIRQSCQKNSFKANESGPLVEKSDIPYCGEQTLDNNSDPVNIATSSKTQSNNKVGFFFIKIFIYKI